MKLLPIKRGRDGQYMAAGSINGRQFIASGETITEAKTLRTQQIQITLNKLTEESCTTYKKAI